MAGQDASYSNTNGFGRDFVRLRQNVVFLDRRREKKEG